MQIGMTMTKKPCKKCGLIQLFDELWGLAICDSNEAQFYGCLPREVILEKFPSWEYDDTKSDYCDNQT